MAAWRDMDDAPIEMTWVVTRGTSTADYETKPVYFAEPVSATDPGFTVTRGQYGYEQVTVTNPLDVTGRTYDGKVASTIGGTPLIDVTLVDADPTDGEAFMAIARADLATLPTGRYRFDLIENRGTASENTLIVGTLVVSGRASA